MFSQFGADDLHGEEGADRLYAGSGENTIHSDNEDDVNHLREDSDDRPKLSNLGTMKALYNQATKTIRDDLALGIQGDTSIEKPDTLPVDVKAGGFLVSDESINWTEYRGKQNVDNPQDVNNDNLVTPLDLSLIHI